MQQRLVGGSGEHDATAFDRRDPHVSVRIPRTAIAVAIVALCIALRPTIVGAHEVGAKGWSFDPAVGFLAAIGFSATLCGAFGLATVVRFGRTHDVGRDHHPSTGAWVTVLVAVLGALALLSAVGQRGYLLTIGAGLTGGAIAWIVRTRGVSPHEGCADAALGAILTHRAIEGAVVASIYAASAALGALGLGLLTLHAIAETVAVGGLYAPVSKSWAIGSVVALQLAFVAGALLGEHVADLLSSAIVTALLAGVGGALLVAGTIEFRGAVRNPHPRPRGA